MIGDSRLDREFAEFHATNPNVYAELVTLARQARQAGRRKIGIKMLYEVCRWLRFIATVGDEYKLNNNYHSRYARLIMHNETDLVNIFELRVLKSGSFNLEEDPLS